MHVYRLNRPLFELPQSHPAHRFLRAFIECRQDCVGKEIESDVFDQEWFSQTEDRAWSYSAFAYQYLAFDIVLDGWLRNAKHLTASEEQWLVCLPRWRVLLDECRTAAAGDGNHAVMGMIAQVLKMFDLWEECVRARLGTGFRSNSSNVAASALLAAKRAYMTRTNWQPPRALWEFLGSWFADASLAGYEDGDVVREFLGTATESDIDDVRQDCERLLDVDGLPVEDISREANRHFANENACREWLRHIASMLDTTPGSTTPGSERP